MTLALQDDDCVVFSVNVKSGIRERLQFLKGLGHDPALPVLPLGFLQSLHIAGRIEGIARRVDLKR